MYVLQTMCPESGFQIAPNWPQIGKLTMTSLSIFFWRFFVCLVKFSFCSKFHVNIIASSGVLTIFFYKGLTRNPEIGNTPVWVLSNIWILGQDVDSEFGTNVSNKCYWMLQNARVTAFTGSESLRENQQGGKNAFPPLPPPRLVLIILNIDVLLAK